MNRTIYIGDVHGCVEELGLLIENLQLSPRDRLVFLGDLLDKGPDSPGTVRLVRNLASKYQVVLVLGNHEAKHARYRERVSKGETPNLHNQEELSSITSALSIEDIEFLQTAVPWFYDADTDTLAVHAGIPPTLERLPTCSEFFSASKKQMKDWEKLQRIRWVNGQGKVIKLGDETKEDDFWATVYDGRFGHVIFGHEPFKDQSFPAAFPHATGIDLGCVFGNYLCGVEVHPDKTLTPYTVKAIQKYSTPYFKDKS